MNEKQDMNELSKVSHEQLRYSLLFIRWTCYHIRQ